jgi:hypothetical protein
VVSVDSCTRGRRTHPGRFGNGDFLLCGHLHQTTLWSDGQKKKSHDLWKSVKGFLYFMHLRYFPSTSRCYFPGSTFYATRSLFCPQVLRLTRQSCQQPQKQNFGYVVLLTCYLFPETITILRHDSLCYLFMHLVYETGLSLFTFDHFQFRRQSYHSVLLHDVLV